MISGAAVATSGYLSVAGRPEKNLYAAIAFAAAWIGSTACLLPALGVVAVGVGWIVGSLAEAAVLSIAVRRACGARVIRHAAVPLAAGAVGCAIGGVVSLELSPGLTAAVAGCAAGAGSTALLLVLGARSSLTEGALLARQALRRGRVEGGL